MFERKRNPKGERETERENVLIIYCIFAEDLSTDTRRVKIEQEDGSTSYLVLDQYEKTHIKLEGRGLSL